MIFNIFIITGNNKWEEHNGTTIKTEYKKTDLQLSSGAIYTIRLGVTNKAGVLAIHETDGVKLDIDGPQVKWKKGN